MKIVFEPPDTGGLEVEQNILKDIMQGGNEKVEKIIELLNKEYFSKQPFVRTLDPLIQEIVRSTFALLLKITDSLKIWKSLFVATVLDEKEVKKLLPLWSVANRMRLGISEKKKMILSLDQYEKQTKLIVKQIKDKVDLLLKFRSAAYEEQEGLKTSKTYQLITREIDEKELITSPTEQVKTRLGKWKNVQLAMVKDENKENSLTSSAIEILLSNITQAQLISQLENYYTRGIVLYSVMKIFKKSFKRLQSNNILCDILAWFMGILKTNSGPFHYSQLTTTCGVEFQLKLRYVFFKVIKYILGYIARAQNSKTIPYLLDALKCNYTASDHIYINKLQLLPALRANNSDGIVAKLWGKALETEDQGAEALIDTFELIAIKIATRVLLSPEKKEPVNEDPFPLLEKTRSVFDPGSSAKIFEAIIKIILDEVSRAVKSYENCQGVEIKLAENYNELLKSAKDSEEDDPLKDKKKLRREFGDTEKTGYSHDFCVRLLRLLYHLSIAVQEDSQFHTTINLILAETDCVQLLKLLQLGSLQQQFLILQILPSMSKYSLDNLEKAATFLLNSQKLPRYTKSSLIDTLLTFALHIREGIWFATICCPPGGYSITKCAIESIRDMATNNKDISLLISSLAKVILFGSKEEWSTLPPECRNRRFIELIISIAGGEAESLHKGARGFALGHKGYSIVCFTNSKVENDKVKRYDWEFDPKKHNEVMLHLGGSEGSVGDTALIKANVSECVPKGDYIILKQVVQDLKTEHLAEMVKKILVTNITSENSLMETILVKILKCIHFVLKKNKELNKIIYSDELLKQLLTRAIQKPRSTYNRSLTTTEFLIEEVRKAVCQSECKSLIIEEACGPFLKIEKSNLVLFLLSGYLLIPIISHKNIGKNSTEIKFECVKYKKGIQPDTISGKIVFVPHSAINPAELAEIAKVAKGIVLDTELSKIKDAVPQIILIQISEKHMEGFDNQKAELAEIGKYIQSTKTDQIIADYINIKSSKNIEATNVREILNELIHSKPKVAEEIEPKKLYTKLDPLRVFSSNSKCESIFKDKNDAQIMEEKEILRKEFATSFAHFFDRAENPSPDLYMTSLSDLRLFYFRRILHLILLENFERIKSCSSNMYYELFVFFNVITVEGDYNYYGMGNKGLVKKINELFSVLSKDSYNITAFVNWIHTQVERLKTKFKIPSFSIFTSSQEDLQKGIYIRFVHRFLRIIMKNNPEELIKNEHIGELLTDLLSLLAMADSPADKYRCILDIKRIFSAVETIQNTLSLQTFTNILTSKCIKTLSNYYNSAPNIASMISKNGNELMQKANAIFRTSLAKYGEDAITYCIKDDDCLFTAAEVMKAFPDFKKLLVYAWCRMNHKELKLKCELRIDTPKPLCKTQYCILVQDPLAQDIEINSKKQSSSIA